jgi:uncharacterized protein (TIGR02246 family)
MYKTIIIGVIATCICSCQQEKTGSSSFDKAKIAREVRQVSDAIHQAGNDRDAGKLYSHFSDSVTGVFDGMVMGSWEEHKKEGHAFFASQKEIKYTIDSIYSIDVIDAEASILAGTYSISTTDTTGKTVNSSHAWTYVFKKQNGEWKVVHFHQSTQPK